MILPQTVCRGSTCSFFWGGGDKTKKSQGVIFHKVFHIFTLMLSSSPINLNILSLITASSCSPLWRFIWRRRSARNWANVANNYERGDRSRCAWCQIQQEDESLAQNKSWVRSEVLGQPGAKRPSTHNFRVSNQSKVHFFGLWEESGGKTRRYGRRLTSRTWLEKKLQFMFTWSII